MHERDELTPRADAALARRRRRRRRPVVTAVGAEQPPLPRQPRTADASQALARRWILTVCCVAQFMVILDLSIVNVALPSIQFSLSFSSAELQWVVDAYAIAFAGFLMLGGRVADRWGQRRTFVAALALFSLASLAGRRRADTRDAGRCPRDPGLQLRVHGRVLAGDHHVLLRARSRSFTARSAYGRR